MARFLAISLGSVAAGAAALVLGYFGFQAYLKWMLSGQTGLGKYDPVPRRPA